MKKKLIYTSLLLSILEFISKILGFVKESLLAYNYGATYITDGYLMAQNIITAIFASLTAAVVVGYITTMGEKRDDNKTLNALLNSVFVFFTLIGILMFFAAPYVIRLFAPGFDQQTINATVKMLRIIIPFGLFYSVLYILSADLQTKYIFWHIGIFNLLANIVLIVSVILSQGSYIILSIGYGMSILVSAIFVFILCRKKDYKYKLQFTPKGTFVKNIIIISYPIYFIEIFTSVMTLIDRSFASSLGEGIITNINYANRVITLVLSFFVSIISTVLLPSLVKKAEKKDKAEFRDASSQIVLYDLFIILFITAILLLLNKEIINFMFYRGAFSYKNSLITAKILKIYAIGLVPLSLNSLLKSQLYSLKQTKKTMFCTIASILINVVLDAIMVKYWGYKGLAYAYIIASYSLTVMFFVLLFKKIKEKYKPSFYKDLFILMLVFGLSLVLGIFLTKNISITSNLLKMATIGIIEGLFYIVILYLLKFDIIEELLTIFIRRRNKNAEIK